jgi:hypothetical protein
MFIAFGVSQSSDQWDSDYYLIQQVRGLENILVRGKDRKGHSKPDADHHEETLEGFLPNPLHELGTSGLKNRLCQILTHRQ